MFHRKSTDGFRRARAAEARGYSMTELMIGLALVAIVGAATLPFLAQTIRTYERNGASRRLLAAIRLAQSEAILRGSVMAMHWGADPLVGLPPGLFRIVRDGTGSCSLPAAGTPQDGTSVILGWENLGRDYPGVQIESIRDATNKSLSGVMFNPFGASVNTCTGVSFPITVTLVDASGSRSRIEIRGAGGTRAL